jgi:hypothetical protein
MSRRLPFLIWIGVLVFIVGYSAHQTQAQTPKIYLDVADTSAAPGAVVPLSIFLQNMGDSIQGFQLSLTLSRPDIMEFKADTMIQTCYKCADEACTTVVAYPCTVAVVPSSSVGTLTHNWDYVQARTYGSFDIQLTGIVDNNFDRLPLPILPYSSGVLIKVIGSVFCEIPDTLQDRTVFVTANIVGSYFSNTKGTLIQPLSFTSGSVTILQTNRGDLNSDFGIDVFDIVKLIDIVFSGGAPSCPDYLTDVNCDGSSDVFDLIYLIEYAFSGGPPPC